MRRLCAPPLAALLAIPALMMSDTPQAANVRRGLTEARALARAYDAILDARPAAEEEIRQACGPAPAEACQVLRSVALWWRIQLNPYDRSLDAEFVRRTNGAIAAVEAWTEREPERAEAWFYLGGAYGARVQWRVLRGERLAAARDGKRINEALEQALELDPALHDAYFGIGLYHYYADVAPRAAKILRWLLFLPGGNRAQGLSEMLRARQQGELLQGEADYQLHILYLWYEQQPGTALALLKSLRDRYPRNPLFLERIAAIQDSYFHDRPASFESYRRLLDLARQRVVNFPELAEVQAHLGMATELDALYETDRAIEHLNAVVGLDPDAPYGSLARAYMQLGAAHDRMGQRQAASAAYRAAIMAAPIDDPAEVREQAAAALRHAPEPRAAEAYRLSIEGWRFLQRRALAGATEALKRSLELRPADPVTRFRYAKLLIARDEEDTALAEIQTVIRSAPAVPATVLADAYLEAGRLLERAADRQRAIDMYVAASRVSGAEPRTRTAAVDSLRRLRPASSSSHPTARE